MTKLQFLDSNNQKTTRYPRIRWGLIGTNSENCRLGRLGICICLAPGFRNGRFCRFRRPAEPSAPKSRRFCSMCTDPSSKDLWVCAQAKDLADFGEILVFLCKTLKTRRICSRCYGVAKYQMRLNVFQLETSFSPG